VCAWCDELHQAHTPQAQKSVVCVCLVRGVAPGTHTTGPKITLPNTDYAHKNITRNFSQARSALPEDGSQRIRNTSEFLIVF